MKRIAITLFSLLIISNILAQSEIELHDTTKRSIDTNYIKTYSDLLTLKLYLISKTNKIKLYDPLLNSNIQYKPNERVNVGLGMNYKWIGFGLALNLGGSANNDDDIYGETKQLDIQLNAYTRRVTVDAYFQHYIGYYLLDPQKYNSLWVDSMPYEHRPDIQTIAVGIGGLYSQNFEKLSYRSSFILNERQKRSAGSFLFGAYFSLNGIVGDSSLIPKAVKDSIIPKNDIVGSIAYNYGPAFGYIHSFIIKKRYFITLSLILGLSRQNIKTYTEDPDYWVDKGTFSGRSQSRFAIGINEDKWFLGISAINDNYSFNNQSDNKDVSKLNYEFGHVRLFYGRRFNVKKQQELPD